jgi:hypothetical protein
MTAFDCEIDQDERETFSFQPSEVFLVARYEGGERRNGLFVGNNPISRVDPLGLEWQFSVGISGTAGGGFVPFPNGFVNGGTSVGVTGNGRLFIQFQGGGMVGAGWFAGVGVGGGVTHTKCPVETGITTDKTLHGEINAGWGEADGLSGDYSRDGQSAGFPIPKVRAGAGFGVMAAGGVSTSTTIATPELGPLIQKIGGPGLNSPFDPGPAY